MRRASCLIILLLMASLAASGCQGLRKNPIMAQWPKVAPAKPVSLNLEGIHSPAPNSCSIRAVDLIGAWVTAVTPEKDSFFFTDAAGKTCKGTFEADVLPLFTQSNLWYSGAPSCRLCHTPDIASSYARLDLSSYQGILAGSARESPEKTGESILGGGGPWEKSSLYNQLTTGNMPPNQPATVNPLGPLINAGVQQ
jgi:hypothetical protein